MEKFIKIAESIADLEVFNAYKLVRVDIQLNENDNKFYAYIIMQAVAGKDQIDIKISPDGSFSEIWEEV